MNFDTLKKRKNPKIIVLKCYKWNFRDLEVFWCLLQQWPLSTATWQYCLQHQSGYFGFQATTPLIKKATTPLIKKGCNVVLTLHRTVLKESLAFDRQREIVGLQTRRIKSFCNLWHLLSCTFGNSWIKRMLLRLVSAC